jgi:glycosyl transferase, family 25
VIPLFVIHLEAAVQRQINVQALKNTWPGEVYVVEAVRGVSLEMTTVASFYSDKPLFHPRYPFPLSMTEIGCFLSHRAAWQKLIDMDVEHAVILEDDVKITEELSQFVGYAVQKLNPADVVRLWGKKNEMISDLVANIDGVTMFVPRVIGLGMQGLIVSKAAAHILLKSTERFDRPVDTFLQMNRITGIRFLTVWPPVVEEISAKSGGTTIHRKNQRGPLENALRALKRARYRIAISNLSNRTWAKRAKVQ